jgi:hypothetical protein
MESPTSLALVRRYLHLLTSHNRNLNLIGQKFLPLYSPSMTYAVNQIQQRPAMRWCDKIAMLDGDLWSAAGKRET